MKHARSLWKLTASAFAFVLSFSLMATGQGVAVLPRVTQPIDLGNLVTLRGNTYPLARPEFDQGAAPDSQPMERILLVLQRSTEQEAALRKLLDEQQIKSSPSYHMWLTPEQFGQQFGPADADIQAVIGWLTSQGFQISHVAAGRTVIEFSGTAGQVRQALHTEIHRYVEKGEEHWANASDPQIPAALAPVVAGFASLNNFPKKPRIRQLGTFSKSKATGQVRPLFTFPYETGHLFAVGPGDFATIYNVTPLWNANIDGTGQTIAVVEDTNINPQDVTDFRTMFGLPANSPQIILNGPDPGVIPASEGGDEPEADLDVEWAGAVAKGATIDMVVAQDTDVTAGVDLAALYIIDNNIASVMSSSYGLCEAFLGSGSIQFYNTLWAQGAAQGITILIANGDTGSAGCDDSSTETAAIDGLAVSGNATTPFNVAVGGTDFNDSSTLSTYWSQTNNSSTQASALSYIPEMTWNDTCASSGSLSGCPPATGIASDGQDLVAGSGGPSNCAYPVTNPDGSISCTATSSGIYGIPKPSWQSGTGVPADGVRDTPDVSLFAGDGVNGSFYVYCDMDENAASGGSSTSCDLNSPYLDFQAAGGTSFAAPAFAGIIAMLDQKTGQRQGNVNYVLYPLAAASGASCGSNATMAPTASSSSCIFYDIQAGNNSVACVAGYLNCSNQSDIGYGILVNPNNTAQPAWVTSAGFDLATGLGTVNAANLVNKWTSGSFTPTTTTLSLSPTPTTYTHGQSVTVTVNVSPTTATGGVSLLGGPSGYNASCASTPCNLGITSATLSSGTASTSTTMLPGGSYNVTAHYAGDGAHAASDSSPVAVTVSPENSKTLVQVVSLACTATTYGATTVTYGSSIVCPGPSGTSFVYSAYFLRVDVTNSSGSLNAADAGGVAGQCYNSSTGILSYQCPSGQVTVTDSINSVSVPINDMGAPADNTPGTYTLNSQGFAEDQFIQLPGGTNALAVTYSPHPIGANASYNTSQGAATITVTPAATTSTVSSSSNPVQSGATVTVTATVATTSLGLAPTGTVQFMNNGTLMTNTVTYTGANASVSGYASLTATITTSFTANASITAQYSGDGNYQSSTAAALPITISSGTPDFSLNANPTTFSISSPGASGSTAISASSLNSFTGTVSVTCALPASMSYSNCSLTPTSFTVPGGSSTLTVNTTAPSAALRLLDRPRGFLPGAGALVVCILLLLLPVKARRVKLAFGLLVFALLAAAFIACGGGNGTTITTSNNGTPPGAYTVVVTGTSGNLSHTLNVAVTVQ